MRLKISHQSLSFKFDANQKLPFTKCVYLISLFKPMSQSAMIFEITSESCHYKIIGFILRIFFSKTR